MKQFMLSLTHNPYDPFQEYGKWKTFDRQEGFDTDGLLARLTSSSSELPDALEEDELEAAIDSIVNNPSFGGMYKKVVRDDST
jgi:hypothetical protein